MDLSIIKYLLVGIIVLSAMVILGTWKLKSLPILSDLSKEKKGKVFMVIKKLWEKQIMINVMAIILFAIVTIYAPIANEMFEKILEIVSLIFIATSAIYIMCGYSKFKGKFNETLNEVCK